MSLRVENLSKTYGNGVRSMQGVSLEIGPGIFGLLGPNGAGKSTFMRTIACLQEPDSGAITLDGVDVRRDQDALRRTLGFLPQEFGVYPNISADDLLDYLARLKGIADPRARRAHIDELLELVNLTDARKRAVDTYSGGMRQRFGLAQALLGKPRLLIIDEPTAGLDPAERTRLHKILTRVGKETIVILSTHILEDVSNLCSRVAVLTNGRIAAEGTQEEITGALRGRLWARDGEAEDSKLPNSVRVVSERLYGGRPVLVVASEASPGPNFRVREPDLEDAYFYHVQAAA